MKKLYLVLVFLTQIPFVITAQNSEKVGKPTELFSKGNLAIYLSVLGDDSLQGRGTGSAGEGIASYYLAKMFSDFELKPLGSDNSYFQYIPLHGSIQKQNCELNIFYGEQSYACKLNNEYVLYTSGEQTFMPAPAELVFVGYGIVAPEFDYNDYQSVDVRGKVVVFIDGEPISTDENYFNGLNPTIYSYPESKQRIALSRGAAGSILIPITDVYSSREWDKVVNEFSLEHVRLATSANQNLSILFNPSYSYLLFNNSKYDLFDVSDMHINRKMQSFELNCSISFKGYFKERDFLSANIAGLIEGSDPKLKDKYIIVSAHYDHLGIGPDISGDSIYNGVLDNAIGVAGLLELARVFSNSKCELKRTIIFLLTAAEEKGFLGSIYYTSSPLVPLYKTIANVNIDGLAFIDEFNSIVGIGTEYSTLKNYFEETADLLGLTISEIPEEFESAKSFYQSDQIAFASAGMPSIIIYEGIVFRHQSNQDGLARLINYSSNIYHTPFDDLNQEINLNASVQHLVFLYNFILSLANKSEEPVWNQDSPFIHARLRSIAEKR